MGQTAEESEQEWPNPFRLSYEAIVMASSREHAEQLGETLIVTGEQPPWVKSMSLIRAEPV